GEPVGLDAVELVRVRLPLRRALRSAHGVEEVREVVLVHVIAADGAEGWGECSALERPTYTAEYTDGAWAILRDVLAPAALGPVGSKGSGATVVGHPFASAALADAQLDARLRRSGRSLVSSHRSEPDAGLAWTAVLGIDAESALERRAIEARESGASALKVKVRPSAGRGGRARVGALQVGLPVAVDANGSFRGHEHELVDLAEQLAALGVDPDARRVYVEQPLPADDLVGTAELASKLAVPVALDESVTRPGDVATAWALGAAELVNVKPGRAGGVIAALGFLDPRATPVRVSARSQPPAPYPDPDIALHPWIGPAAFLGGMVETGVGRATALAVGSVLGLDHTDLGPSSWYFDDDLTEPIELGPDGLMRAPDGPGIGVVPRPDRLAEVTIDRLLIRP
ncbi:MAG: enolase C-terminal domain-like protein, partial [Acidimicrobiales bacterium]